MQMFTEIDAHLNSEKSGIVPTLAKVSHSIDDSTFGLDAINLHLDSLKAGVTHPSGFCSHFADIDQAIENVRMHQVQLVTDESQMEAFSTQLSE